VQVNLFVSSTLKHKLVTGQTLTLTQRTDYPWDGTVTLTVGGVKEAPGAISVRMPGWAEDVAVSINGAPVAPVEAGAYCRIKRTWHGGDVIRLAFLLTPRIVKGNLSVRAHYGKHALMRGPLVYCLEGPDNAGLDLTRVVVPEEAELRARHEPDLLGGVTTITVSGKRYPTKGAPQTVTLKAIPYYAWANRKPGAMLVWLPNDAAVLSKPK
jgi:DUF1680 family protein